MKYLQLSRRKTIERPIVPILLLGLVGIVLIAFALTKPVGNRQQATPDKHTLYAINVELNDKEARLEALADSLASSAVIKDSVARNKQRSLRSILKTTFTVDSVRIVTAANTELISLGPKLRLPAEFTKTAAAKTVSCFTRSADRVWILASAPLRSQSGRLMGYILIGSNINEPFLDNIKRMTGAEVAVSYDGLFAGSSKTAAIKALQASYINERTSDENKIVDKNSADGGRFLINSGVFTSSSGNRIITYALARIMPDNGGMNANVLIALLAVLLTPALMITGISSSAYEPAGFFAVRHRDRTNISRAVKNHDRTASRHNEQSDNRKPNSEPARRTEAPASTKRAEAAVPTLGKRDAFDMDGIFTELQHGTSSDTWLDSTWRQSNYIDIFCALAERAELEGGLYAGHGERVAALACMIGRKLNVPEDELEHLRIAGLLHDIGKIVVAGSILRKRTPLTEMETGQLRMHSVIGAKMLMKSNMSAVYMTVLYHHERLDGTGYPHGLRAEAIPLNARILAVADEFETLTTGQQCRRSLTIETAIQKLKDHAGTKFDAEVVWVLADIASNGSLDLSYKNAFADSNKLKSA